MKALPGTPSRAELERELGELKRLLEKREAKIRELALSAETSARELREVKAGFGTLSEMLDQATAHYSKLLGEYDALRREMRRHREDLFEFEQTVDVHVERSSEESRLRKLRIEQLEKEVERLKSTYPLRELVQIQESEIKQVRAKYEVTPENHPERRRLRALLSTMDHQKEQLERLLETSLPPPPSRTP